MCFGRGAKIGGMFSSDVDPGVRRRISVAPSRFFPITVSRFLDQELDQMEPWLTPIKRDFALEIRDAEPLELPKTFLGAQYFFGRTSKRFDDYKGSFSFPLYLSGSRDALPLRYVVLLKDRRSTRPTAPCSNAFGPWLCAVAQDPGWGRCRGNESGRGGQMDAETQHGRSATPIGRSYDERVSSSDPMT